MTARAPSPLERARVRLADAEESLAQNGRERELFHRLLGWIPAVGVTVGGALALLGNATFGGAVGNGIGFLLVSAAAVVVAAITSGTGIYMTAVRKREFEDAVRDARAEIASIERAAGRVSSESAASPGV